MIPMTGCSVLAVAIILERAYRFHEAGGNAGRLTLALSELIAKGQFGEALQACREARGLEAGVFAELIRHRHESMVELEKTASIVGSRRLRDLSKYVRGLGVIGNVTPLMGLLGTVFGMVHVFMEVAVAGNTNPGALAAGIWEALLTTAAGLTVAIPASIAYHYFEGRLDDWSFRLESDSMELLRMLKAGSHDPVQQEEERREQPECRSFD